MELAKATLVEITAAKTPAEVPPKLDVQFNPTSLKLALSNTVTGEGKGRIKKQFIGSSSSKLTLSLVFDTADEGDDQTAVSALARAGMVTQFLKAKKQGRGKKTKFVPPKVRFQWGDFIFDGIMDSVSQDVDLFAADGTALRCKVDFTLTEQLIPDQFLEAGPGAAAGEGAVEPGDNAGSAPGTSGAGGGTGNGDDGGDSTDTALDGESAADFLARQGADPAAWRSLAAQVPDPTAIAAGTPLDFSAAASTSGGLGITAGVEVGISVGLDAAFGLTGATAAIGAVGASVTAGLEAGYTLAAAGGLVAAVEAKAIAEITAAAADTLQAFGLGGSAGAPSSPAVAPAGAGASPVGGSAPAVSSAAGVTPARPAPPEQPRPPLSQTGIPTRSQQDAAAPAPPPPQADPRARSFGFGAPLRPRISLATAGEAPVTRDPTVAPWIALPSRSAGRDAADRVQAELLPVKRCGCAMPCKCKGIRGVR